MRLGILALRAVIGALFMGHGLQKLAGWFGGHGLEATAAGFEQMGMRPGRRNALAAGLSETAGGLSLATGFLTPLGASAVTGTMAVAIAKVHASKGLWVTARGVRHRRRGPRSAAARRAAGDGVVRPGRGGRRARGRAAGRRRDHARRRERLAAGWPRGGRERRSRRVLGGARAGRRELSARAVSRRPARPPPPRPACGASARGRGRAGRAAPRARRTPAGRRPARRRAVGCPP